MTAALLRSRLAVWAAAHPLVAFPLVYLGWAWLFWIPVLVSDESVWSWPNLFWFLIGGASPLIAGLGLAALEDGRRAVAGLLRSLSSPGTTRPWLWAVILLFWLVFDLAVAGLAYVLDISSEPLNINWRLFTQPGPLLFLLLLSFVFPAVEELGLRGYFLQTSLRRLSLLRAGVLNGATWASWHAAFVFFPGYYSHTSFQPALSWWLPLIVCHAVLYVAVWQVTGRSLLAVWLFHAMMNFTGEWLGLSPELYPFVLYVTLAVTIPAGFWLWRARSGG